MNNNLQAINVWSSEEWEAMQEKLECLSLVELRLLATQVGIEFRNGNASITSKEDFILVLDEADPSELERAYKTITKSRKQNK